MYPWAHGRRVARTGARVSRFAQLACTKGAWKSSRPLDDLAVSEALRNSFRCFPFTIGRDASLLDRGQRVGRCSHSPSCRCAVAVPTAPLTTSGSRSLWLAARSNLSALPSHALRGAPRRLSLPLRCGLCGNARAQDAEVISDFET